MVSIFATILLTAVISHIEPEYVDYHEEPIILQCDATAYCYGSVTATGKPVREGFCAMSSSYIGMTAIVYDSETMECIGMYEVEDTGSDSRIRNGTCIDIYNPSKDWCLEFGRRKVVVYLYNAVG